MCLLNQKTSDLTTQTEFDGEYKSINTSHRTYFMTALVSLPTRKVTILCKKVMLRQHASKSECLSNMTLASLNKIFLVKFLNKKSKCIAFGDFINLLIVITIFRSKLNVLVKQKIM